jgi:hypothetical protein
LYEPKEPDEGPPQVTVGEGEEAAEAVGATT